MRLIACRTFLFICFLQDFAIGDCRKLDLRLCNEETGEDCEYGLRDHERDESSLLQNGVVSKASPSMVKSIASKISSFWTNPIVLGILLGLLLIGPDHLGTLMALSTLTTGSASFKVGFAWGIGHSMGMLLIAPLFFLLRVLSSKKFDISLKQWEYYGDYFIGASMVLVAVYFVVYESRYLEKQEDGSYRAKSCGCHPTAASHEADVKADRTKHFCASFGKQVSGKCCTGNRGKSCSPECQVPPGDAHRCPEADLNGASDGGDMIKEDTPLLPNSGNTEALDKGHRHVASESTGYWAEFVSVRDLQGAILGTMQGLCCPMGLASVGFMGRMTVATSPMMLLVFAGVFVLASGIGSGVITLGWGAITSRGSGDCISPRTMYMASCIATFFLGMLWITANACGVLENINFGDKIHQRIMGSVHALHA